MKSINGIIAETKADYSPYFEFTWEIIKGLCKYANVPFTTDITMGLRLQWQNALIREDAIRPILAECERLMA